MSRTDKASGAEGPAAIRRDIARSRVELAETVEELAARADVRSRARGTAVRVADRVRGRTPEPVRHATSAVARAATGHPRPALAAAAGVVVAVAVTRHRVNGRVSSRVNSRGISRGISRGAGRWNGRRH
ncbi:DUF3618 domain-containing protein [Streptomyces sp. KL116D]|uniref:DUF3618 domain-containing protein n=1 Tax=Streptomyces sp. KL116D TaxID=3045152 RepID=UPI00355784A8